MTMADLKCEICQTGKPIGVACTMMPYSCAYCMECAQRYAQPLIVFETLWETAGANFDQLMEGIENIETFDCGRYMTYREWATRRAGDGLNGYSRQ